MSRFPVAFRLPAFRFSVIRFPPGSWALLAVGLPDAPSRPDPDGVTTFRTHELRPGWVPPLPRGRWCSSRLRAIPSRHPPLRRGQSLSLATSSHQRGSCDEASTEVYAIYPSDLPLACTAWMGQAALGFALSSEPRRPGADDARQGGDRPSSTGLKLRLRHQPNLRSARLLITCDLVSQLLPRLLRALRHPEARAPGVDPTFVPVVRIERDVGVPLISLIALTGQRSPLRRLRWPHSQAVAEHGAGIGCLSGG